MLRAAGYGEEGGGVRGVEGEVFGRLLGVVEFVGERWGRCGEAWVEGVGGVDLFEGQREIGHGCAWRVVEEVGDSLCTGL